MNYNVYIIDKKKILKKNYHLPDAKTFYYLVNDYFSLIKIKNKLSDDVEIKNLSGVFDKLLSEIKDSYLKLFYSLGKINNSTIWWGTQIASRNPASTPLLNNIIFLLFSKKIISEISEPVAFIVDSPALGESIYDLCFENNIKTNKYRIGYTFYIKSRIRILLLSLYFLYTSLKNKILSIIYFHNTKKIIQSPNDKILIRSWITDGNLRDTDKFINRNFGDLPDFLEENGLEVWNLPLFFNLSGSLRDTYRKLKKYKSNFIMPDLYLKIRDYFWCLSNSIKLLSIKIDRLIINDIDVSKLISEVISKSALDVTLCRYNLCFPLMKRLKDKKIIFTKFYYPFECNSPEKLFILGIRKYYPQSTIIGFQHTTFFPNQFAYQFYPGEYKFHPLPDKLICSGPKYIQLHEEANFPSEILFLGSNLRYNSVYDKRIYDRNKIGGDKINILLPLSGLASEAFECLEKVNKAIKNLSGYNIFIRTHPLISKKILIEFLKKIRMNNYIFADDGIIQNWFLKSHVAITPGISITTLEAVSMGVPVIRVMPDNSVHYDVLSPENYPLKPVVTYEEIREQMLALDKIYFKKNKIFMKIKDKVLSSYFTKPDDKNMKVFIKM